MTRRSAIERARQLERTAPKGADSGRRTETSERQKGEVRLGKELEKISGVSGLPGRAKRRMNKDR